MNTELFTALVAAHGPSGREGEVAAVVRPELDGLCDTVIADPLGTLLGIRGDLDTDVPRLMLAAHMDEIGLMVTGIDDAGFLKIIPLGGWDPRTLVSQAVVVHGRRPLPGVVGTPPVHVLDPSDRAKAPKVDALSVDVGLGADTVRELVRPGDVITRERPLRHIGNLLSAKALDDRVGVYVMIEALRAAGQCPWTLVAAATVQEEVGLRGARAAAHRIAPRVGIAIDTCPSGDGPGMKGGGTRLGEGAAIRIMDASAIGNRHLVDLMESLATEKGIPHQFHVSHRGGTDTQSLQLAADGAIAGCISIPQRYGHSSVEVVHPDDVQAAVDLLAAVIENIDQIEFPA